MFQQNKKRNQSKRPLFNMYWMYGLITLSLLALYYFQDNSQTKNVNWTEFENAALAGDIDKIMVITQNGVAEGFLTEQGAKNLKFDMSSTMSGEKKIETTFRRLIKFKKK